MPAYATAIPRPSRTLTELEQGHAAEGDRRAPRCVFAVALGTGLREHEMPPSTSATELPEDGRVRRAPASSGIVTATFRRSRSGANPTARPASARRVKIATYVYDDFGNVIKASLP